MLAALLANIRYTSYPIQAGRGKRQWWLDQYPKEVVDEKKEMARRLKRASERLRFMTIDSEAQERFKVLAKPYTVGKRTDYIEMALDAQIRHEIENLLQLADDEEFFLWF